MSNIIGNYVVVGVESLIIDKFGTNETIDIVKHLKGLNIENTGDLVRVKGGAKNKNIISWSTNKASKLTFTNATRDLNLLALQTGGKIVTTTKDITVLETHKIVSNKITLEKTIKGDPCGVFVDGVKFTKGTSEPTENEYTISGQGITFAAEVSGTVDVSFITTTTTQETVNQNSENEAAMVSLTTTLLLKDTKTKVGKIGVLTAKCAKLSDNFNINAQNEGEPEALTLEFELDELDGENTWELTVTS